MLYQDCSKKIHTSDRKLCQGQGAYQIPWTLSSSEGRMGKMATAWQVHTLLALYSGHTNLAVRCEQELRFLEKWLLAYYFLLKLFI